MNHTMGQNYLIPIWDSFWCERLGLLGVKEGRLWSFLTNWFDGWRAGIYIVLVSRTVGPAAASEGVVWYRRTQKTLHLRLYNAMYTLIGCAIVCVQKWNFRSHKKWNTSLRRLAIDGHVCGWDDDVDGQAGVRLQGSLLWKCPHCWQSRQQFAFYIHRTWIWADFRALTAI